MLLKQTRFFGVVSSKRGTSPVPQLTECQGPVTALRDRHIRFGFHLNIAKRLKCSWCMLCTCFDLPCLFCRVGRSLVVRIVEGISRQPPPQPTV